MEDNAKILAFFLILAIRNTMQGKSDTSSASLALLSERIASLRHPNSWATDCEANKVEKDHDLHVGLGSTVK